MKLLNLFLNVIDYINKKWLLGFDNKYLLDNELDIITKYSFSQLNEFYEEKIKKFCPKSMKTYDEIIKERKRLKIEINNLNTNF